MGKIRVSERKLILFTVGLLIIAGLVRLGFYRFGKILFYLSFAPLVFHRVRVYVSSKKVELAKVDKQRRFTLAFIIGTITLNLLGFQDVEFVLLLLLAIDYLIVDNNSGRKIEKSNIHTQA